MKRLAARLEISEKEASRQAIQNFNPTTATTNRLPLKVRARKYAISGEPIDRDATEGIAAAVKMERALDSAMKAVDEANESVHQMRRDLHDPIRRVAMEAEIRQQLSGDESLLDEVAAMARNRDMEGGAQ